MNGKTTPKTLNLWYVAFVAGMATFVDQMAIMGFGTALVLYSSAQAINQVEVGVLTSLSTIALAAGALVGGRLGDRFGRHLIFLITMAMIVVGTAICAFFVSYIPLIIGFILFGFGVGADLPVSLATISEAADDSNRAKLLTFSNLLGTAGITAAVLTATVAGGLGILGGQIIFGLTAVVGAITFALRFTVPESDSWKAAKKEAAEGVQTVRATQSHVRELLIGKYARPMWTLLIYYTLATIAVLVSGQFGTYVAVNVAGMDIQFYSAISLIALPAALLGGIWFMKIADTSQRMPYFIAGAIGVIASYVIQVIFGFNPITIIAALALITFAGAFCYETIMKVWAQESFPVLLRSTAQGLIYFLSRVAAAILAIFTPTLLGLNPQGLYAVLAAVAAVSMVIGYLGFHKSTKTAFDDEDLVVEVA